MRKRKVGECFICGKDLVGADTIGDGETMLPKALPIPGPGKNSGNVMACTDHPGVMKAFLNYGAGAMLESVKRALAKVEREEG